MTPLIKNAYQGMYVKYVEYGTFSEHNSHILQCYLCCGHHAKWAGHKLEHLINRVDGRR